MRMKYFLYPTYWLVFYLSLGCFSAVHASNIRVSKAGLTGQNLTTGVTLLQFDLSWENSWRYNSRTSINNWDAAWVFAKFRLGEANPTFSNVSLTHNSAVVNNVLTANLRVGMPVVKLSGSSSVPAGVVIISINSPSQITLSANVSTSASNNQIEFQRIWEHAWLGNSGHNPGSGVTAEPGLLVPGDAHNELINPAVGAFIYRSVPGSGPINLTDVQLQWNYRTNGLSNSAIIEIQVFAIEMVFVPQGAFFLGPAESNSIAFNNNEAGTGLSFIRAGIPCNKEAPFRMDSLSFRFGGVSTTSDTLYLGARGSTDLFSTDRTSPLIGFPNGFSSFYAMKYELSQGNYREFLNTLTRIQQDTRTATALPIGTTTVTNRFVMSNTLVVNNRNGIRCNTSVHANHAIVFYNDLNANGIANESDDGEWIACNFLSWMDGVAYLDWAGLRPMTELEFEKASRGNEHPVAFENAWGDASIVNTAYTLTNPGAANEQIASNYSSTSGNAAYQATTATLAGPLRSGIFATANSTRKSAGASFWGVFELSGNLREQVVTVASTNGRIFSGIHGNGVLSPTGNANVINWHGQTGGEVTTAAGSGQRGGSWNDSLPDLAVANRVRAITAGAVRTNTIGIRGLRTRDCPLLPAPALTISQTVTPVGSIQSFSVSGSGNYRWLVPADWEILSGQGTSAIAVMVGRLNGRLRVAEVNECGTGREASVALPFLSTVCTTGSCASGGIITEFVGDGCNGLAGKRYRVHTFSAVGMNTLTLTSPVSLEYVVIGGAGASPNFTPGGAGAGGYREGVFFANAGQHLIQVGARAPTLGGRINGGNSEAFGIVSHGGGAGGAMGANPPHGADGGSGGGGTNGFSGGNGNVPATWPVQGYGGGNSVPGMGGGGGGAGQRGFNAASGGGGGSGRQSNITGTLLWYAGGGGGHNSQGPRPGGLGDTNFGGADSWHQPNGVVIIRYIIETP